MKVAETCLFNCSSVSETGINHSLLFFCFSLHVSCVLFFPLLMLFTPVWAFNCFLYVFPLRMYSSIVPFLLAVISCFICVITFPVRIRVFYSSFLCSCDCLLLFLITLLSGVCNFFQGFVVALVQLLLPLDGFSLWMFCLVGFFFFAFKLLNLSTSYQNLSAMCVWMWILLEMNLNSLLFCISNDM